MRAHQDSAPIFVSAILKTWFPSAQVFRSNLPPRVDTVVEADDHEGRQHWTILCHRHQAAAPRRHALGAALAHLVFAGHAWRRYPQRERHVLASLFADELLVPLPLLAEHWAAYRRPSTPGEDTYLNVVEILASDFRVEPSVILRRLELLGPLS